jgi:hypothetical protein
VGAGKAALSICWCCARCAATHMCHQWSSPLLTRSCVSRARPLPTRPSVPLVPASENLRADAGAQYDQVIEINLGELEPQINGPFTPDLANPLSQLADNARREGWPLEVSGEIGACVAGGKQLVPRWLWAAGWCCAVVPCPAVTCPPGSTWSSARVPAPPLTPPPASRPHRLLHQLVVRGHDARGVGGQAGAGGGHQGQGALRHLARLRADPCHH